MREGQVLRQNIGIDISKSSFEACYTTMDMEGVVQHKASRKFKNTKAGFEEFLRWSERQQDSQLELHFTMEATGIYHEGLAYFLKERGKRVSVLLPNMVKKYAGSLNQRSKTDKIDAKVLGRMGVERLLPEWKLSSPIFRKLRKLTRERVRLLDVRVRLSNFLESEEHSGEPHRPTIDRLEEHVKYVNKQIKRVEREIKDLILQDDVVSRRMKYVLSIPGVGLLTFAAIISETQGFDNFRNLKQLYSYAGYDVQQRESGKYKGRSRISKKGNRYIRRALYMPAMAVIRHSETFRRFYERIKERSSSRMVSLTAVQRKLLGLIYTLYKKEVQFIDNYDLQKEPNQTNEPSQNNTQPEIQPQNTPSSEHIENKKSGEDNQSPTTQDRQDDALPSFSNAKLQNRHKNEDEKINTYLGT